MNILTINVSVCGITHMFKIDGSIIPLINIYPPICVAKGRTVDKLILPEGARITDASMAQKDKLEIKIYSDECNTVEVNIVEKSEYPRRNLLEKICPICGSELQPSQHKHSIGRCMNRGCMAQITPSLLFFLSAIGVVFQYPLNRVLDSLLIRGSLTSLSSIFFLTMDDFQNPTGDTLLAQLFMQQLHSVRGTTTVGQILRGIRVPGWEEADIAKFEMLFETEKWSLMKLIDFLEKDTCMQYDGINWGPWLSFIATGINTRMISELCYVLYR